MTPASHRTVERLVRGLLTSRSLRGGVIVPIVIAFVAGYVVGRGDFSFTSSQSLSEGQVIRIVDGDTVHAVFQGKEETIRLLRINTPERGQPGYQEATQTLADLLANHTIRLEFEKSGELERDNYQRILAYIFIGDINVNVEMVRSGWTRFWTKYGRGRYADAFERAQTEAQNACRGLWDLEKP